MGLGRAVSVQKARGTLASVLKKGDFQSGWWAKQQERFWENVAQWLRRIFRHVHLRSPDLSGWGVSERFWRGLGFVVLALGALALIYLIAVLLLRWERPRPVEEERVPEARPKLVQPHAAWLEQAARHARADDYLLAVRALHMAALMKLDEAGLVRYDHAYTDHRFVRLLQARGQVELARALGLFNSLFARLWYGQRAAGVQEYEQAEEHWRAVEGRTHE